MEGVRLGVFRFPSLEVLNEHDRHGNKVQENVGDVDEDVRFEGDVGSWVGRRGGGL